MKDQASTKNNPLNSAALAYLGDAVFELYIREKVVYSGMVKSKELHGAAVQWVKAAKQAQLVHQLLPLLSEEEQEVLRRGRNCKAGQVPKNTSSVDYRLATGFEALIGYLYVRGEHQRLAELLSAITKTDS